MKRYAWLMDFRLDSGATWLNLLATSGRTFGEHPQERIATPARLAEWFSLSELAPVRAVDEADVQQAQWLRERLRPLAMATVAGSAPPVGAVAELADFLDGVDDPVRLEAAERLVRAQPATAAVALARIARQAVDHLTGPARHDLAICPEHDCRGVFANPGGRRRWCPAPACASRGRVRAMRARRKS
ncbi:CGNR zinc finger domain-containing protein [Fodinicola feengrottensis]|uniref:CGNR zinc finger domain-containing protein n=1 Tax=Fodinicola feengrottensis TaxID=435914 RepID=A0ABP4U8E0_9ACTN|nr:CGNR zinc finger domain-containing protein [Fodinicola feengrottensis]